MYRRFLRALASTLSAEHVYGSGVTGSFEIGNKTTFYKTSCENDTTCHTNDVEKGLWM